MMHPLPQVEDQQGSSYGYSQYTIVQKYPIDYKET